jgi:hypothetical protein
VCPEFNYYLTIVCIAAFSLVASSITAITFHGKVRGLCCWTAGYAFYFFAMCGMLILCKKPFIVQNLFLTIFEAVGGYLQFIGFYQFYHFRNKYIFSVVSGTIGIACITGLVFQNISLLLVIKQLTFVVPAVSLLLLVIANRKIESKLHIPIMLVFTAIVLISAVSALRICLGLTDHLSFFYGNIETRRYGVGVVFLTILVFSQNQLANGYLQKELVASIQALETANTELSATKNDVVSIVAESLESRLSETSNHVRRVSLFTRVLLDKLNYYGDDREDIITAAALHDIGKIGIPDVILSSPARYSPYEMNIMKTHAESGYAILSQSQMGFMKLAASIAFEHHENWDGSGYPCGKKGASIQFASRVVAVADTFDALVNARSYKEAWNFSDAAAYISLNSGIRFDPEIACLVPSCLEEFDDIVKMNIPV